jgi:hypothetical protein
LGEILHAVGGESILVVAFALHGMGPNPGWSDLLPDILARLEEHRTGLPPRRGLLYRLKQRLPFHRVRPLLNRLPNAITHRLVSLWSRNMFDWSSTRFFPLPMDEVGLIRINLRGLERGGIVEPGAEYDGCAVSSPPCCWTCGTTLRAGPSRAMSHPPTQTPPRMRRVVSCCRTWW